MVAALPFSPPKDSANEPSGNPPMNDPLTREGGFRVSVAVVSTTGFENEKTLSSAPMSPRVGNPKRPIP